MLYYGLEWQSCDTYMQFKELSSVPGTPPANEIRQYAADSGGASTMCWKNDAGAVICLPSVGGGGTLPTGTGANGRVTFWTGTNTLGSDALFFWNDASNRLGLGTGSPAVALDILGSGADTRIQLFAGGTANTSFQLGRTGIDGSFSVAGANGEFSDISLTSDTVVRAVAQHLIVTARNATGEIRFASGALDTQKAVLTNAGLFGVGVTSPATSIHSRIESTTDTIIHERYGTSAGGGFTGRGSRGTIASPTQVLTNDNLVGLFGQGRDNAGSFSGNTGVVTVKAAENYTATARGSYITLETTPTGSTTRAERWRVTDAGVLQGRVTGGSTVQGGSDSGADLTLSSTSNATKGNIHLGTASTYDEVNDRLGIGTTTPELSIHTKTISDSIITAIMLEGLFNGTADIPILFRRARHTGSTPNALQSADNVASFSFRGHDGTSYLERAMILANVNGTVSTGVVPIDFLFRAGGSGMNDLFIIRAAGECEFTSNTWAQFVERGATPTDPANGAEMNVYMKADKFIIQYNDGGTVRYKYLDLTGTGVTWVHTTTAP